MSILVNDLITQGSTNDGTSLHLSKSKSITLQLISAKVILEHLFMLIKCTFCCYFVLDHQATKINK
jgi:hypothetical protein